MNPLSPIHLTAFDALIDGALYASVGPGNSYNEQTRVNLYYIGLKDQSVLLASFTDESVFGSLIGGWPTVDDFNSAMAKRRSKTLNLTPKETASAAA